ncbi:helix-turn-helix domain-containing protein [Celeribacter persicus]|uniref:Helix-turn-helix protein n=1 Tax=Celeribacter persicus TaxID=1651082 RepID=A0A2T5HMG8_9RHOB|nr:helix-turn-helix transcriptional regulator [Celeribacter persicus]PTQ72749.1 helix-turn-helix protein [Celeribacter persicus]
MTSQIAYVGQRMRETREKTGYSQGKFAAMLELSDRAYKNYELGKREPPLAVAALFSSKFNVDLRWLVFGEEPQPQDIELIELAAQTSDATYAISANSGQPPLGEKTYGKFFRYVLKQCFSKGSSPSEEAKAVYELMRGEDE